MNTRRNSLWPLPLQFVSRLLTCATRSYYCFAHSVLKVSQADGIGNRRMTFLQLLLEI
jgi:hypothetical protein